MGMSEDDRIRRKNAVHNLAYDLYQSMIKTGLDEEMIADTCDRIIKNNSDPARNEIYSTILKIVGRSDGQANT